MPSMSRIAAYLAAGIPAAIGVYFVGRYAYTTSDTHETGLATAALFAMTAAGAFAGPAVAIAVSNAGRRAAGCALGLLALAAIAVNWTNTLGAIAQRGAGSEARASKTVADTASDRRGLARLTAARAVLTFTPASAEAVAVASAAARAAERTRAAECGNGEPKQRGKFCREREADERAAADKLVALVANKAATDQAAKLDKDIAEAQARIDGAPASPHIECTWGGPWAHPVDFSGERRNASARPHVGDCRAADRGDPGTPRAVAHETPRHPRTDRGASRVRRCAAVHAGVPAQDEGTDDTPPADLCSIPELVRRAAPGCGRARCHRLRPSIQGRVRARQAQERAPRSGNGLSRRASGRVIPATPSGADDTGRGLTQP
jgi:hypothetical protein